MAHQTALDPELGSEVTKNLDRLGATDVSARRDAAAALSRLGVWALGSDRTRGSLGAPAANRLPQPARLAELVRLLSDSNVEVRCQAALALGEWGGEEAAGEVARLLATDPSEAVRQYCVTSLRLIGGPAAVEGLSAALERGPASLRHAALQALEELMTGGSADVTERPMRAQSEAAPLSDDAISRLARSLARLQADELASRYVRLRAGEVARLLGETARPEPGVIHAPATAALKRLVAALRRGIDFHPNLSLGLPVGALAAPVHAASDAVASGEVEAEGRLFGWHIATDSDGNLDVHLGSQQLELAGVKLKISAGNWARFVYLGNVTADQVGAFTRISREERTHLPPNVKLQIEVLSGPGGEVPDEG